VTTLGERIKARRDAHTQQQAATPQAMGSVENRLTDHDAQLADLRARIEAIEKT
jgi:hypothetical protein